ncbi:MAG: M28 family peptidase, partial [Planctomycetes bacterium]|nr:M28 family peptidase [Planctomycetota bacterium]
MRRLLGNAVLTLVLGALCLAALFAFNRLAAPQPCILPPSGVEPPNYKAIAADVTEEGIRKDIESLCRRPSRSPWSEGLSEASMSLLIELQKLGYEVLEQPFAVTAPFTRHASIGDEAGRDLAGIAIHPLLPNWFRTVTTPHEGLRGKVFRGEKGLAREFKDVDLRGNFALLPLGTPWTTVAGMGAAAVLYYDDGKQLAGARWGDHVDASVNLPRFLVTGDAASLAGGIVTIKARVDLATGFSSNIVAILDVPNPDGEAVVVNAHLDAHSYAPDVAPGAQQAGGVGALLSLAKHLAAERAHLKRSVVLIVTGGHAQGLAGMREFIRALGAREQREQVRKQLAAEWHDADGQPFIADLARRVAQDPDDTVAWGRNPKVRGLLNELLREVLNQELMAAVEEVAQRRVDWVRDGLAVRDEHGGEAKSFAAYGEARKRQLKVQAILSAPPDKQRARLADYLGETEARQRLLDAVKERANDLHLQRMAAFARACLAESLSPYRRLLFLSLDLTARSGRVGLVCGEPKQVPACQPADAEVAAQFRLAADRLQAADPSLDYVKTKKGQPRFANLLRAGDTKDLGFTTEGYGAPSYFESLAALWAGYPAFSLVTLDDNRETLGTPFDTLENLLKPPASPDEEPPLRNLAVVTRLVTAAASQLARGHGRIVPLARGSDLTTIRGEVVSQVGDSLTPNHPMPGALVRFGPAMVQGKGRPTVVPPGVGTDWVVTADWRGRFELPCIWPTALSQEYWADTDIDAAVVRPEDGEVTWTLSTPKSGEGAPYAVRRVRLAQYRKSQATAVVFRAAPVQMFPMADPATLRPYAGFDFIETKSMAAPQDFKVEASGGTNVCFVPPDSRLYFTFKKGQRRNPNLMEIRAFALGATGPADGSQIRAEARTTNQEIQGNGYFAADTPSITNIELDAALSMAQLNARRTRLQDRYGMADDMVLRYNERAATLADEAQKLAAAGRMVEAKRLASESLAYSANIHPVIRKNASDAVVGILFYLFLAIPFALFTEKLLVGHPDLRVQVAVQGVIFLLFFLALRAVHPAVQLVRSPYVILLGFITFALAAMVTAFLGGRFKKNLAELSRRREERAEAADVSRAGAAATAFLLGLSNLRKRPVRTGLTIGTLILTTFVMLCFASFSSDVVDVEFALGKAPYTGLLVRDRGLKNVADAAAPLRELYGEQHVVVQRDWQGSFEIPWGKAPELAEFTVSSVAGEKTFEAKANALLGLDRREPDVTPVKEAFHVLVRWFEANTELSCFLSRAMADQLRLDDEAVKKGTATVSVGGRSYAVLGIFDGTRLDRVADLDGEPLLPVDILSVRSPASGAAAYSEEATEIPENVPRLPADRVVLVPVEAMPS